MKQNLTSIVKDSAMGFLLAATFFAGTTTYHNTQYNQRLETQNRFRQATMDKKQIGRALQIGQLSNSQIQLLEKIQTIYQNKSKEVLESYNVSSQQELMTRIEENKDYHQHKKERYVNTSVALALAGASLLSSVFRRQEHDSKETLF